MFSFYQQYLYLCVFCEESCGEPNFLNNKIGYKKSEGKIFPRGSRAMRTSFGSLDLLDDPAEDRADLHGILGVGRLRPQAETLQCVWYLVALG